VQSGLVRRARALARGGRGAAGMAPRPARPSTRVANTANRAGRPGRRALLAPYASRVDPRRTEAALGAAGDGRPGAGGRGPGLGVTGGPEGSGG
jgi:hypothetical protein